MFTESRSERFKKFTEQVRNQLIVSCQALAEEPLFGSEIMARMAVAAEQGGAKAIRANTPVDVAAIKKVVKLPIIGLYKQVMQDYPIIITPTLKHALEIAAAGADVIAIDATARPRPTGDLTSFMADIHEKTGCLILADISNLEEALAAEKAGADMVSSTLSGYTSANTHPDEPDIDLIKELVAHCSVPVLAEGRYHTPEQVKAALANGALSVVVGGAITRPKEITARYVRAINS